MSKFNQSTKGANKTTNREGHVAYKMSDKEHLVTSVLTTMFGEPKFYGSTDEDIVKLAVKCAHTDPEFLCKLACYARNVGNMRSISHVLTAIIAREAKEYTRTTIKNVIVRPDDILEIMSCYKSLYGKPFPNAMKRQIAEEMNRFDEYGISKYNSDKREFNFKDVLRICHPVPQNEDKQILFNHIVEDKLETPYTWETELSSRGNTKEVWEELIASNKVGYMALLRNLRNIVKSGADVTPVLDKIKNPEEVKKSRQLPFRFYSAFKKLDYEGEITNEIRWALNDALTSSIENLPTLPGRTLIAVDVSGSMSQTISRKSDVTCRDISVLLGCLSARMCEDATVVYFSSLTGFGRRYDGYKVVNYSKYSSILDSVEEAPEALGGTDMSLPLKWAIEQDKARVPFDRIIYLSDNQCNYQPNTVQSYVEKYKQAKNSDPWVHAIDLQGYGTQQFIGKKFNLIAGWSDSVLSFIKLAEDGISTLVDTIDSYDLK